LLLLAVSAGIAPSARATSIEEARRAVVAETLRYLNTPYLWGGQHPVTGMDCSGFVQQVFRDSGLALPRVSQDQFRATDPLRPSQVHPGDLIFFSMKNPGTAQVDHVGIYMGRGYFVAASTSNGVHIDSIRSPYYLARLVGVRKYRGF
jgi:cell wall-associated NlpC family hydrolase